MDTPIPVKNTNNVFRLKPKEPSIVSLNDLFSPLFPFLNKLINITTAHANNPLPIIPPIAPMNPP